MAIFNECTTDFLLLEKATREEYRKRSFKKKYNYEPSKEDPDVGTITDKQGKKYRVDMRNKKKDMAEVNFKDKDGNWITDKNGKPISKKFHTMEVSDGKGGKQTQIRQTAADVHDDDSTVFIDKNFWKLKGSHKNERRDAILQHELGHQNLHNISPNNKTVDKDKRHYDVAKNLIRGSTKDATGIDLDSDKDLKKAIDQHPTYGHLPEKFKPSVKSVRNAEYRSVIHPDYEKSATKNKDEINKRLKDLNTAKKFETNAQHAHAYEFEADRYAANRTSERAVKKGVANVYKLMKKDYPEGLARKTINQTGEADMAARKKALNSDEMRKAETYKPSTNKSSGKDEIKKKEDKPKNLSEYFIFSDR